jgi:hypothetical protein
METSNSQAVDPDFDIDNVPKTIEEQANAMDCSRDDDLGDSDIEIVATTTSKDDANAVVAVEDILSATLCTARPTLFSGEGGALGIEDDSDR